MTTMTSRSQGTCIFGRTPHVCSFRLASLGGSTRSFRMRHTCVQSKIPWPLSWNSVVGRKSMTTHTGSNLCNGQIPDSQSWEKLVTKILILPIPLNVLASLSEAMDNFRYRRRKLRPCVKISSACCCVLSWQECWYPNENLGDRTALPPQVIWYRR